MFDSLNSYEKQEVCIDVAPSYIATAPPDNAVLIVNGCPLEVSKLFGVLSV